MIEFDRTVESSDLGRSGQIIRGDSECSSKTVLLGTGIGHIEFQMYLVSLSKEIFHNQPKVIGTGYQILNRRNAGKYLSGSAMSGIIIAGCPEILTFSLRRGQHPR